MTILQATQTQNTEGFWLSGDYKWKDNETFLQEAGRVADLVKFTVTARRQSDLKLVPLTDLSPALVPANLLCGGIGGTAAEFAALTDAELSIDINGETIELADIDMTGLDTVLDTPGYLTSAALAVALPIFVAEANAQFGITVDGILRNITCDFSGIDSVLDTAGYMTCGAIGGTLPDFQAVNDGEFGIAIDGQAAVNVGPVDFSGLDTVEDTAGFYIGGANGTIVGNYIAVNDGSLVCDVDGVTITLTGLDWTAGVVTFFDVAAVVNNAFEGRATMLYDIATDIFRVISNSTGETSIVDTFTGAGGTDVSAAGFFNMAAAGTATAGTGGEGTAQTISDLTNAALVAAGAQCFCYYNGDAFVFVSLTRGETSAVADLTAGGGGTDVSGAAFYNGLAGANVAGTGGENLGQNVSDVINGESLGLFRCHFDGDQFIFTSRTAGELSTVGVLTAGAAGTDVSGAGFINGAAGAETQGTGGEGLFESISGILNAHAAGRFTCFFNGDAMVFISSKSGLPASTISLLSDPAAGGTYIGGAGFLNGEVAGGTIIPATGQASTAIPTGIFAGEDIATADLVAGDVEDQIVVNYGDPATFDIDKLNLENSLDIDDVVQSTGKTIRQHLTEIGLIASTTDEIFQSNPLT